MTQNKTKDFLKEKGLSRSEVEEALELAEDILRLRKEDYSVNEPYATSTINDLEIARQQVTNAIHEIDDWELDD